MGQNEHTQTIKGRSLMEFVREPREPKGIKRVLAIIVVIIIGMLIGIIIPDDKNDAEIKYDEERKGTLTNITKAENGVGAILDGRLNRTHMKRDTYVVTFDSKHEYVVNEYVANKLKIGGHYYYQPQINGSRILIDLNK